eukprot:jgi/Picsp_1/1007/NSC_04491-R1_aig2-like family protein
MAKLFVYGTLMYPEILEVLLHRVPESTRARVQGYKRYGLKKFVFPAVVEDPSSQVEGILLTGLSDREMVILDEYEGEEYRREVANVTRLLDDKADDEFPKEQAIIYIWRDEYAYLLNGDWDKDGFESKHFDGYLSMCKGFIKELRI